MKRFLIALALLALPGPLAAQTTTTPVISSATLLIFPSSFTDLTNATSNNATARQTVTVSASVPECGVPKSIAAINPLVDNPSFWYFPSPFNTANDCVFKFPTGLTAGLNYGFAVDFTATTGCGSSGGVQTSCSARGVGANRFNIKDTVNPLVAPPVAVR